MTELLFKQLQIIKYEMASELFWETERKFHCVLVDRRDKQQLKKAVMRGSSTDLNELQRTSSWTNEWKTDVRAREHNADVCHVTADYSKGRIHL